MLHKNFSSEADENCTHNFKAYLFCFICVVVLIILTVSIATIDLKIKTKIFILKIPLIKGGFMISTRSLPRIKDNSIIS